jgi:Flp pilus assembly protein TadG
MNRAQITIEAILIFGLLILLFIGVSVPLAFKAKNMAADAGAVADARYAAEQIAAAANSISTPGEKRTINVYIPGSTSVGRAANGEPLTNITTTWSTNGTHLLVGIAIKRYHEDGTLKQDESYNIIKRLYGQGWSMPALTESSGRRYNFVLYWRNITWT